MAETDKKDGKPEMQEIASIERDFNKVTFGNILRNEDDTLISRGGGKGLKIYDELERDCHAYAVLQKRKLAVISRPWDVTPASEDAKDVQAADLVRSALERIEFDRITMQLLDATLKGFSVGEVMWEVVDGAILPKDVLSRDQRRFTFDTDSALRLLTREALMMGIELPERKFIVHRFGAKDGSPFGLGLGSKLFWPVMFKRQSITFWLVFADKFGSPTAHGKYPPGANPSEQAKLLAALQAIAQDAGIITPQGMEIELLEAARSGSVDTYEKLVRYMDEQISKAVLGETMSTTAAPAGLGSSQANVQNDVRLEVSKADGDMLSATIRKTLVQWIIDFNMPGAGVPSVYRNFDKEEDKKAQAETDEIVTRIGYEPDQDYITRTYGDGWTKKAAPPPQFGGNFFGRPTEQDPAFAEAAGTQRGQNLGAQQAFVDASEAIASEWQKLMGGRVADLRSMLDETGDLALFRERMGELLSTPPSEQLQEAIARANFAGHIVGRGKDQKPTLLQRLTAKLRGA